MGNKTAAAGKPYLVDQILKIWSKSSHFTIGPENQQMVFLRDVEPDCEFLLRPEEELVCPSNV